MIPKSCRLFGQDHARAQRHGPQRAHFVPMSPVFEEAHP
jgi:hypothetical protein